MSLSSQRARHARPLIAALICLAALLLTPQGRAQEEAHGAPDCVPQELPPPEPGEPRLYEACEALGDGTFQIVVLKEPVEEDEAIDIDVPQPLVGVSFVGVGGFLIVAENAGTNESAPVILEDFIFFSEDPVASGQDSVSLGQSSMEAGFADLEGEHSVIDVEMPESEVAESAVVESFVQIRFGSVPEPSRVLLLVTGALCALFHRRRK